MTNACKHTIKDRATCSNVLFALQGILLIASIAMLGVSLGSVWTTTTFKHYVTTTDPNTKEVKPKIASRQTLMSTRTNPAAYDISGGEYEDVLNPKTFQWTEIQKISDQVCKERSGGDWDGNIYYTESDDIQDGRPVKVEEVMCHADYQDTDYITLAGNEVEEKADEDAGEDENKDDIDNVAAAPGPWLLDPDNFDPLAGTPDAEPTEVKAASAEEEEEEEAVEPPACNKKITLGTGCGVKTYAIANRQGFGLVIAALVCSALALGAAIVRVGEHVHSSFKCKRYAKDPGSPPDKCGAPKTSQWETLLCSMLCCAAAVLCIAAVAVVGRAGHAAVTDQLALLKPLSEGLDTALSDQSLAIEKELTLNGQFDSSPSIGAYLDVGACVLLVIAAVLFLVDNRKCTKLMNGCKREKKARKGKHGAQGEGKEGKGYTQGVEVTANATYEPSSGESSV